MNPPRSEPGQRSSRATSHSGQHSAYGCGVVVVAHNRAELVQRTLRSIYEQRMPAGGVQVALVDSGSTDGTAAQLGRLAANSPPSFSVHCMEEPGGGASRARNLGWRSLSARIIAFIDDDAEADPGWLLAALAEFDRFPRLGAIAGRTRIDWLGDAPPEWLARAAQQFTALDLGDRPRRLRYPRAPIGPNMIFRREALEQADGFDEELGPTPERRLVCEEGDLSLRLERLGWEVRYVPGTDVRHLTPGARITPDHLLERARVHGLSRLAVDWKHFGASRGLWQLARLLRGLARGACRLRFGLAERLDCRYAQAYFGAWFRRLLRRRPAPAAPPRAPSRPEDAAGSVE